MRSETVTDEAVVIFLYNSKTVQVLPVLRYNQGARDWPSVGTSCFSTYATRAYRTCDYSELFSFRRLITSGRLGVSDVSGSANVVSEMPEIPPASLCSVRRLGPQS